MRQDSFVSIRKEMHKEAKEQLEKESNLNKMQVSQTTSNFKALLSRRIKHSQLKVTDRSQRSLRANDSNSSPRVDTQKDY